MVSSNSRRLSKGERCDKDPAAYFSPSFSSLSLYPRHEQLAWVCDNNDADSGRDAPGSDRDRTIARTRARIAPRARHLRLGRARRCCRRRLARWISGRPDRSQSVSPRPPPPLSLSLSPSPISFAVRGREQDSNDREFRSFALDQRLCPRRHGPPRSHLASRLSSLSLFSFVSRRAQIAMSGGGYIKICRSRQEPSLVHEGFHRTTRG